MCQKLTLAIIFFFEKQLQHAANPIIRTISLLDSQAFYI